jgi:hypothetical protein
MAGTGSLGAHLVGANWTLAVEEHFYLVVSKRSLSLPGDMWYRQFFFRDWGRGDPPCEWGERVIYYYQRCARKRRCRFAAGPRSHFGPAGCSRPLAYKTPSIDWLRLIPVSAPFSRSRH